MQRTEQDLTQSVAKDDYRLVKSYLQHLGAPFYDSETQKHVNSTPIHDITNEVAMLTGKTNPNNNRFYLKQEYKNRFTKSVKGRAVALMVLRAIESEAIYSKSLARKRWIEPTSGNTGIGLAEFASLLGIEFTAVFSRLDVPEEIKSRLRKLGANILTIGSEYSLDDLRALAQKRGKYVAYYWASIGSPGADSESLLKVAQRNVKSDYHVLKNIGDLFLIDTALPLAMEASKQPIIVKVQNGEFEKIRNDLITHIPELLDQNTIVAFVCSVGNTSLYLSNLLNQLGFTNVCSIRGGIKALQTDTEAKTSSEFCPVPGSSITKSSIEFVKKLVQDNPEEYFTFMQYENADNVSAHMVTTGPELQEQVNGLDYLVCAFGTGGTATGLAKYFDNTHTQVIVAFPERPVEGIRTVSGASGLSFYKPELYSQVIRTDNSKLEHVLRHFANAGLGIGPSTAVAILAAIGASAPQNGKSFVIIGADGIENYVSEYKEIPTETVSR